MFTLHPSDLALAPHLSSLRAGVYNLSAVRSGTFRFINANRTVYARKINIILRNVEEMIRSRKRCYDAPPWFTIAFMSTSAWHLLVVSV